jgi:predicted MFS family arabinose efflux permease
MSPRVRLGVGWLTMFVIGCDAFMISPLLPAMAAEFGVSPSQAGLSVTVFSVAYMLGAPVMGNVADRLGRRRTLISCMLVFAFGNWLTAIAPSFALLLAARAITGAAAAGMSPLIYAGVGEAAPPARRASWVAVNASGVLSAICFGASLGPLLAASYGSRPAFYAFAVLSLVLALANRVAWPADAVSVGAQQRTTTTAGAAGLAMRLLPTALWATAIYGMYTYLGTALADAGYSPAHAARAISLYGIGALAGALIGGRAADRFGTPIMIVTSLSGLGVGLAVLGASLATEWLLVPVLVWTSVCAQSFWVATQALLVHDFPERRATVLACNNATMNFGISFGSLVGGQAFATGGFTATTAVATTMSLAAAVIAVIAGSARRRWSAAQAAQADTGL